jgi:hypothetical protein
MGAFSPTRLTALLLPAGPNPYSAVSKSQYSIANSDGATWKDIDSVNLKVTVAAAASATAIIGANADLFTANVGYNQDIAIFVSVDGGADQLVSWKESGGFAGTFSPNATFAEASYTLNAGSTYIFKLKWKTNKNAPGATIFAGAGPIGTNFSPTTLTVQLIS